MSETEWDRDARLFASALTRALVNGVPGKSEIGQIVRAATQMADALEVERRYRGKSHIDVAARGPEEYQETACPIFRDPEDGSVVVSPYVRAGSEPVDPPRHLVVLEHADGGAIFRFVDIEPRLVNEKLGRMLKGGAVQRGDVEVWIYTMWSFATEEQRAQPPPSRISCVFPGRSDRFYFHPERDVAEKKAKQLAGLPPPMGSPTIAAYGVVDYVRGERLDK